jgi:hypothetical protein
VYSILWVQCELVWITCCPHAVLDVIPFRMLVRMEMARQFAMKGENVCNIEVFVQDQRFRRFWGGSVVYEGE